MKYISVFVLLMLVSANNSIAQITFTSDELIASFSPQNNQTNFVPASLDGLQTLIDKSGPLQTWDFTGTSWKTDSSMNLSTSTFFQYPGSAPLADDPDFTGSTHVMKYVSSVPGDPITYEFLKIDPSGFWILGESQDSFSVQSKILSFNKPFHELKLPLTYQTSWIDSSAIIMRNLPQVTNYIERIDAVIDGFGTLILPGSTSDCLRLKMKVTLSLNFSGVNFHFLEYEFLWITSNGVSAVIDADSNQQVTSTSSPNNPSPKPTSFRSPTTNSVSYNSHSSSELSDIYLSQNPAQSETRLYFTAKSNENVKISLMDALGSGTHMLQNGTVSSGRNCFSIDLSKYSAGCYFIRTDIDGMTLTRKLIIAK
jgi:hypothetical protein